MCGIAGFATTEKIEHARQSLTQAVKTLAHRGPDSEGLLAHDTAGLAVKRLAIVDRQTGDQPIVNEDGSIWVVLNGEIYNYQHLREGLIARGHRFSTASDTEVIVHLYEELGEACLKELQGIYAIAVWDDRKQRLLLARDLMGVKPLVYLTRGNTLWFGSEIKALIHLLPERKLNLSALHTYLVCEYVPAPDSIFEGISKLPAGGRLTWQRGTIKVWQEPLPPLLSEEPVRGTFRHQFQELLAQSLSTQLPADHPVILFLSGGLDSGVLASLIERRGHALTVDVEGCSPEEAQLAAVIARQYGWTHELLPLTAKTTEQLITEILDKLDEPYADASIIPTYLVCREARKYGPVAFSGDGGDELFGGYETYRAHLVAQSFPLLPKRIRSLLLRILDQIPPRSGHLTPDFLLRKFIRGMALPPPEANVTFWGAFLPDEARSFLNQDVRASLRDHDPYRIARSIYEAGCCRGLQGIMDMDLRLHLGENLLGKVDHASGAVGLEVRVPYLHTPLVSLARSMPATWKVTIKTTKLFFRQTFADRLPRKVAWRKKHGFNIPLGIWLKDELYELVSDTLSERSIREAGIFSPPEVRRLIDDHRSGRKNNRQLIWVLFMFELWRQRWLG